MKKSIIAIALCIVAILCSSIAIADTAKVVLAGSNNRLAGAKNLTELEKFSENPVKAANATKKIGGLGSYGYVLREKNMVKNGPKAFSEVELELIDADFEYLEYLGIEANVEAIMAATIVEANNAVGHRFCIEDDAYFVAMLKNRSQYILVVTYDWDQNGSEELCLVPGGASQMGYNYAPKTVSSSENISDTEQPSSEPSTEPSTTTAAVPNPTLRPSNSTSTASTSSTTTVASAQPNPTLRGR